MLRIKHAVILLTAMLFIGLLPSAAQDATLTGDNGVTLTIEGFEQRGQAGDYRPANGVYMVMWAKIANPSTRQACIFARDVRLIYDGQEYAPERPVMEALRDEFGREFIGPVLGHCAAGGDQVDTFAAFDVPAGMETFSIRYHQSEATFAPDSMTALPSRTPAPTQTPAPTRTPRPTRTPLPPSATPSQEQRAITVMEEVIGRDKVERISMIDLGTPKLMAMDFPMFESFSGYEVTFTALRMIEMACALRDAGFTGYRFQFSAMINLVSTTTGQEFRDDGLTIQVEPETAAVLNCENIAFIEPALAVDDYQLHPALDGVE